MHFISLLLISISSLYPTYEKTITPSTESPFFRIEENQKIGFIDSNGTIIIPPIFHNAGDFSEGLAPARKDGNFGYIDKTGKFVIAQQYEYAYGFREGLAVVYKHGKPFYINKEGEKAFESPFDEIYSFRHGCAKVSKNRKMGLINNKGELLLDTIYSEINTFVNGFAVVTRLTPTSSTKYSYESAVVDTQGKFIIEPGIYPNIYGFKNGFFRVEFSEHDSFSGSTNDKTGFVDTNGKLVLAKGNSERIKILGDLNCGLIPVELPHKKIHVKAYPFQKTTKGFINIKGELIFSDTNFVGCSDFSDNRSIVQDAFGKFHIINLRGKVISKDTFEKVGYFNYGFAMVKVHSDWCLVDTNGNYMKYPLNENTKQYSFYERYVLHTVASQMNYYRSRHPTDPAASIFSFVRPEQLDSHGFKINLLIGIVNGRLSYVNREGKIVWQQQGVPGNELSYFNIDYRKFNYYSMHQKKRRPFSKAVKGSRKNFKRISQTTAIRPNSISLVVNPQMHDTFRFCNKYHGMEVFLVNTTGEKLVLNLPFHSITMRLEALDQDGIWKEIEEGKIGNHSQVIYHLENKEAWSFTIPVFEGAFKTKLRMKLIYSDFSNGYNKEKTTIYSNEFDGNINPAQFWRISHYNGLLLEF